MDAFLRHGGGYQEVEGGQILDRRGFTWAACSRADRPYSQTQRERRVRLPLPPGLGLTLDPFVRGLMFYYGLDFHDLAPNFILNISTFIVVCEAFLRGLPPHQAPLRPVAEDLQCEAEDDRGVARRVRRCCNKQKC